MKKLGCISLLIFSLSLHADKPVINKPEQHHIFFAQLLGATLMGGAALAGLGTYASLQNINHQGFNEGRFVSLIALAATTAFFFVSGAYWLDQAERHI